MQRYQRLSGDSGVLAFTVRVDAIDVKFVDGNVYTYSYASTGRERVEQMKLLARAGKGLATYISQHVRADYASVTKGGRGA
jgi:hypothetical protein